VISNQTKAGVLYIVATPIGNLDDLSPRAVSTLGKVDLVLAEDTRHSRKLLSHFGIKTSLFSLHEHNEKSKCDRLINRLEQGKSMALISDAGTPLISDPGFPLVSQARRTGLEVVPLPGPCAAIAALSVSGIGADRFVLLSGIGAGHALVAVAGAALLSEAIALGVSVPYLPMSPSTRLL
jgi:16S rRNA (cytidine1402-2'-O)-methyltransferase